MTLKEAVEEARRRRCGIRRKGERKWLSVEDEGFYRLKDAIATNWEVEPVKEEKKRWIAWLYTHREETFVRFTHDEKPFGLEYERAPWLDKPKEE